MKELTLFVSEVAVSNISIALFLFKRKCIAITTVLNTGNGFSLCTCWEKKCSEENALIFITQCEQMGVQSILLDYRHPNVYINFDNVVASPSSYYK